MLEFTILNVLNMHMEDTMTRDEVMNTFHITKEDIAQLDPSVYEKCFCGALIRSCNTTQIQKILEEYQELKKVLEL